LRQTSGRGRCTADEEVPDHAPQELWHARRRAVPEGVVGWIAGQSPARSVDRWIDTWKQGACRKWPVVARGMSRRSPGSGRRSGRGCPGRPSAVSEGVCRAGVGSCGPERQLLRRQEGLARWRIAVGPHRRGDPGRVVLHRTRAAAGVTAGGRDVLEAVACRAPGTQSPRQGRESPFEGLRTLGSWTSVGVCVCVCLCLCLWLWLCLWLCP
jgi:hypothetical protein